MNFWRRRCLCRPGGGTEGLILASFGEGLFILVCIAMVVLLTVLIRLVNDPSSKLDEPFAEKFTMYLVQTCFLSLALLAFPLVSFGRGISAIWLLLWLPVSGFFCHRAPLRWRFVPIASMMSLGVIFVAPGSMESLKATYTATGVVLLAGSVGFLYAIYRTRKCQPKVLGCGREHVALSDGQGTTGAT